MTREQSRRQAQMRGMKSREIAILSQDTASLAKVAANLLDTHERTRLQAVDDHERFRDWELQGSGWRPFTLRRALRHGCRSLGRARLRLSRLTAFPS